MNRSSGEQEIADTLYKIQFFQFIDLLAGRALTNNNNKNINNQKKYFYKVKGIYIIF